MQARELVFEDWDELVSWWKSWGWECPPMQDFLPDNGVMIYNDNGENICAGFLYIIANAPVAWFTFPVSNPLIRKRERKDAINLLINTITESAKALDIKYLYSSLRNQSMIDAQVGCGYSVAGTNHTELLKVL